MKHPAYTGISVEQAEKFEKDAKVLSSKWLKVVFIYLVLLYSLTFIALSPEKIPQTYTLILTVLIYLFIVVIFLLSPVKLKSKVFSMPPLDYTKLIQYSWILWLVFLLIFPFIAGAISIELVLMYLFLLGFGVILFLSRIFWVVSCKFRKSKTIDVSY